MNHYDNYSNCRQAHNHEIIGSTRMAERGEDRHNHRFAAVSGRAIPVPDGNHVHELFTNTDFSWITIIKSREHRGLVFQ